MKATVPKYRDRLGYDWKTTKKGGLRRNFHRGLITVFPHKPRWEHDRCGFDYCIMVNSGNRHFGGIFPTLEEAAEDASNTVSRELL